MSAQDTIVSNRPFIGRLGAIAGLVGVAAGVALGLGLAIPVAALQAALQLLPNLAIVTWLACVAAVQWPRLAHARLGRARLGRGLGWAGAGAAMVGLSAIAAFNLLRSAVEAGAGGQASALLASPAMPWLLTVVAVLFVWGFLALGTASLQAGLLPRGAVVLWTLGSMASIVTQWLPVSLANVVGVLWSSFVLFRGVRVQDAGDDAGGDAGSDASGDAGEHPSGIAEARPVEPTTAAVAPGSGRLIPLDALRGLIMILMAIDHASFFVRRWHPFETWDQPLPDYPNLAALLTRLATHPCAPGFFLLMGAGMVLFAHSRRELGWSGRRIAVHLALRGLLFIALEQVIVDIASAGRIYPLEFSILSGLGVAMLLGIPFLGASGPVQAAAGAAILLLMQVLPGLLLHADLGMWSPIRLLLVPGAVGSAYVLYAPIPWLGVVLLGMAFARLLLHDQRRAYRAAAIVGLACLALFPLVRVLGGFGNLRLPAGQSAIAFLNLVKYPPSLSFLLLSLGFDLVALYLLSRIASRLTTWGRPVVTLGRAALFFFLVHWFVYAAMGLVWSAPGGLPQTYLAWAVGLVLLYPVCKTFEAFKHSMPAASVWRMV
ncbi:MAG: DUF1624 domain-containing protein [Anaerolineae bacterium]|nr:DUF1624 domain-containing protein [Anaerolineae bacterium]